MPAEVKLKLQIEARHIAQLTRHALFKRATRRVTRKLYSVYYDTPDLDLWQAGVTLRLRRSGKHWTQTVQSAGGAAAGLLQCREFTTAITSPLPDFSALAASDLAAHFASIELRAQLKPVAVTELIRASCMMTPADNVAIETSIDRGHIKSGDAIAPVCEIGLAAKEGPAWRAYQVAMQLLEVAPLLVEERSRVRRAIALHLGKPPAPVKMPLLAIAPDMCTNEVFKALVLNCLAHYTGNQHGMLNGDDPEYLHQMRVALRRLRSVFSTFAPLFSPAALAQPITETRWIGGVLGEARDWDVFAIEALPPVLARYDGHAGLAALARVATRLRGASNRKARLAIASARGQGLLLALGAWTSAETWLETLDDTKRRELQQSAIDYARGVLNATLKRVHKRGRDFATLAPPDLHRLRVAAKRLRYATEFFAPLFNHKAARDYRAVLARLQDALGSYNDAVKMTLLADRAGRNVCGAQMNEARGIMLGWSAGMQHAGRRHLARLWKDFRHAGAFWH